jgi:hypothetical protein
MSASDQVASPLFGRAFCRELMGQNDGAVDDYRIGLAYRPYDYEKAERLARLLLVMGRPLQARAVADVLLKRQPTEARHALKRSIDVALASPAGTAP